MTIPGDPASEPAARNGGDPALPATSSAPTEPAEDAAPPAPAAPILPPYAYSAVSSPYQSPANAYGAPGDPHAAPHAYGAASAPPGAYQSGGYAPPGGWQVPLPGAQPPHPAAWQQWPVGAPPARRSTTLARVALGLAIPGAILAFVPFLSLLSGPLLLAAFIIAIVALASKKQTSKGVAASALVLSIVAWIVSVVIAVTSWFSIPTYDGYDDPGVTAPEYEEPYTSAGEQIPLVESATGPVSFDESAAWFVAVVDTPASAADARYLMVEIEAVDASGDVIDHSSGYVVEPRGLLAFEGTFYELDGQDVASLVVRATSPSGSSDDDGTGAYRIGPLTSTADSYSTTVSGTIGSTYADDQEYVRVVVIARSPAGDIIGADTTYVDLLPGGGDADIEAQFYELLPADTLFEAIASR